MWIVFSLLAALAAAIVVTLSKAGIKDIDSSLGFAIQSILIIIVAWSVVAFQGSYSEISKIPGRTWIFLVCAGVVTCLSSLFSFYALKLGDASRVAPIERSSLILSIFFAVIFLKEKITLQIVLGALLMVAGAIIIATSRKEG
jgi:transporter family protein